MSSRIIAKASGIASRQAASCMSTFSQCREPALFFRIRPKDGRSETSPPHSGRLFVLLQRLISNPLLTTFCLLCFVRHEGSGIRTCSADLYLRNTSHHLTITDTSLNNTLYLHNLNLPPLLVNSHQNQSLPINRIDPHLLDHYPSTR